MFLVSALWPIRWLVKINEMIYWRRPADPPLGLFFASILLDLTLLHFLSSQEIHTRSLSSIHFSYEEEIFPNSNRFRIMAKDA